MIAATPSTPAGVCSELGWRPAFDLHEGLERTVRWYLENCWWWQAIREGGFEAGRRQGVGVTATTP